MSSDLFSESQSHRYKAMKKRKRKKVGYVITNNGNTIIQIANSIKYIVISQLNEKFPSYDLKSRSITQKCLYNQLKSFFTIHQIYKQNV